MAAVNDDEWDDDAAPMGLYHVASPENKSNDAGSSFSFHVFNFFCATPKADGPRQHKKQLNIDLVQEERRRRKSITEIICRFLS